MRNALLLILAISVITVAGCKHSTGVASQTTVDYGNFDAERNRCATSALGTVNKLKPVVCIQFFPGGASVNPVITPAARKVGVNKNKIKFIAATKELFDVEFEPDPNNVDCVETSKLRCTDECDFVVNENAPVDTLCKYSVVFSRTESGRTVRIKLDPIVIIDTE